MTLPDRLFQGQARGRGPGSEPAGYDVAQICLSGHVMTSRVRRHPEHGSAHCPTCGEKTIESCPACNGAIRGSNDEPSAGYERPAYCQPCGHAFPWTSQRIEQAIELFADEVTDSAERERFEKSVRDVARETPAAETAIVRLKKSVGKLGPAAAEAMRTLLVDIVSETAKKSLFPAAPPSSAGPS